MVMKTLSRHMKGVAAIAFSVTMSPAVSAANNDIAAPSQHFDKPVVTTDTHQIYDSVGTLVTGVGDCSLVKISKGLALSKAHCVINEKFLKASPEELTSSVYITLGCTPTENKQDQSCAGIARVDTIAVPKNYLGIGGSIYHERNSGYDIALIRYQPSRETRRIKPDFKLKSKIDIRQPVTQIGYFGYDYRVETCGIIPKNALAQYERDAFSHNVLTTCKTDIGQSGGPVTDGNNGLIGLVEITLRPGNDVTNVYGDVTSVTPITSSLKRAISRFKKDKLRGSVEEIHGIRILQFTYERSQPKIVDSEPAAATLTADRPHVDLSP